MIKNNIYALLITVGDYSDIDLVSLESCREDGRLMKTALIRGLKVEPERIRCLGEAGRVTAKSVVTALANFSNMLTNADTLIVYFSGHGNETAIYLSDGELELGKIIKYVDEMSIKSRIMVLDFCHSGAASIEGKNSIYDTMDLQSYVGHGTAVIASSFADKNSWIDTAVGHSVFTEIVASVLQSRFVIRKGQISLDDIVLEIRRTLDSRNKGNQGKEQQIIFRTNIGGTIYFDVEEYNPYRPLAIYQETEEYIIYQVKPLHILDMKRLCVFIILKENNLRKALPRITKEVAGKVRYADVFNSQKMENRLKGQSAQVIWCYFGFDESDMIKSLYFAYTIWARNDKIAEKYYKENKYAAVEEGIYIFRNSSYNMLKEMQADTLSTVEYLKKTKELYTRLIDKAELFIADIREVENKTVSFEDAFREYQPWIRDVYRAYYELTDMPVPSDDIYDWSEKVLSMAGWIMDIALIMKESSKKDEISDREKWIIHNSIQHYYEDLSLLSILERE